MSLTCGIVGLPNVGKSTLFNAITKAGAFAANFPFATIEPNVGIVPVKDERLDHLVEIHHPKSIVPTSFSFTDIAGLVRGASQGEGLGNQFLSHIREVDAIVQVIRCFDDPDIIHVDGSVDPLRDYDTINLELILADLEVIDKRLPKIEKKALHKVDNDCVLEYSILTRIKEKLLENLPASTTVLTQEESAFIKNYNFLTMKPVLYVANVDEAGIHEDNEHVKRLKELVGKQNASVIKLCAKIEEDLAGFSDSEREELLESLGIVESGLDQLVKQSYSLLGLATFFTAGEKECRAWTFKKGMKAPECAGIIHTDFEKGFIRAETMSFQDLVTYGTPQKVKEAGKVRSEGKDYIVKDGDIMFFRFNV